MNTQIRWKKYKKEDPYSYTFGAFPTMELLNKRKELVQEILISPAYKEKESLIQRLEREGIPYSLGDKQIRRIANKENIYLIGVFRKFSDRPESNSHVVLDHIQDMGNLGNICRTMLGMGWHDLILLGHSCDFFHPRTVRASMGAIFSIRVQSFASLSAYLLAYGQGRTLYSFMLDRKAVSLPQVQVKSPCSLIFGNEGSGLDPKLYRDISQAVMIPQSKEVDSLNLTTACAIALYHFSQEKK